jgi:dienelactone hydrolase
MDKAGKKVAGLHVIPKTEHGFLAPTADQKEADDKAIDDAWKLIVDYLRQELAE